MKEHDENAGPRQDSERTIYEQCTEEDAEAERNEASAATNACGECGADISTGTKAHEHYIASGHNPAAAEQTEG